MRNQATLPADPRQGLPTLAVCFATLGARILRIDPDQLVPMPGVTYCIFHQNPGDAPDILAHVARLDGRADIQVACVPGTGAARSRNAALRQTQADIILFADDDAQTLPDGYGPLLAAFRDDPDLAFACGVVLDGSGRPRKSYGRHSSRITLFNSARVGTPELAVRRAEVLARQIAFDESFGAGEELYLGDEFIFLGDCLRAGLTGRHLSIPLAVHEAESSGTRFSRDSLRVRKAVIRRVVGRHSAALFLPLFALKNWRRFGSMADRMWFMRPFG